MKERGPQGTLDAMYHSLLHLCTSSLQLCIYPMLCEWSPLARCLSLPSIPFPSITLCTTDFDRRRACASIALSFPCTVVLTASVTRPKRILSNVGWVCAGSLQVSRPQISFACKACDGSQSRWAVSFIAIPKRTLFIYASLVSQRYGAPSLSPP